jgi:hypothetical protein
MPPNVMGCWDDCDIWTQALLIAYSQIRMHEEFDEKAALAGLKLF